MIIDATNINWDEVPEFNVLTASPPCQDWSTAGKGLGEKGWNGGTTPAILHIMERRQPLTIIIEQVVGFKNWIEGGFLPEEEEEGKAFKEFKQQAESLGYEWTDITIQLAHMGIPQFRKRLWCIPTKIQMSKKIGQFKIAQLPIQEHP
jgi:DNA (cytosine-5)-methyltransferase 1